MHRNVSERLQAVLLFVTPVNFAAARKLPQNMPDFTPNLHAAHDQIQSLLSHIHSFPTERLMYHAPVLDRIYLPSLDLRSDDKKTGQPRIWRQEDVMGLKKFIEGIEHHEQHIQSVR